MAIKKTIEIDVNAKNAIGELDHLSKSFDEVYGDVGALSGRTGELEDRMYELALAGDTASKEFKDLAKEVAKAKKVIIDVDMAVDALAMTTANQVTGAIGVLTAGFEIGAGAMGAFGVESEAAEEALLKVASAMAIAQGFQGIKEAIPAFKAMGASAVKAFSGIKGAIAATGIGLFLIALGAVAANWDKIKSALGGATKAQNTMNAATKTALENVQAELSASDKLGKLLKDEGKTREEKVKAVKALQDEYPDLLSNVDAEKDSIEDINTALTLNTELLKLNAEMKALQALRSEQYAAKAQAEVDIVTGQNESWIAWSLGLASADAQEKLHISQKKDSIKASEDETDVIDDLTASLEKRIAAVRESGGVTAEDTQKIKDNTSAFKDAAAARLEMAREVEDKILEAKFDNERKEQEANALAFERFKQDNAGKTELIAAEADLAGKRRLEISNKWNEEMNNALAMDRELEVERLIEHEQVVTDIKAMHEDSRAEKAAATVQKMLDASAQYVDSTMQGLQSLDDLNSLLTDNAVAKAGANEQAAEAARKKGFERSKKLQIAMAVIQGVQGVMAAFTAGSSMGPAGIVMGPLMAAIAGISAIANVAKIRKMKYEGGGGGGAASVPRTPSVPNPASFNVVGDSGTNQLAESLGNQPIKAFVVADDVTTQQSLDRNKVGTATL